ncbi:multidrug effflux MFS transporter [Halobacteriovorax sp. HLS]|uniref:multidrug effflux MFS transporter n=1 Tax=Halobacteriovorax sp. HLS TaxID=2234000 RepID=UPI000FDA37EE|nr:multidrug effflux MFS transporter [Halobacteriovorax sp. HLS]
MEKVENRFIVLMAFLMSLIALSIDAMLPALNHIRESLAVVNENDIQLVISTIFLGMSFGLMLYGPLSDSIGRKKPLYLGLSIFCVGSLISLLSHSIEVMLLGRFLQGFGASSCRVVSVAMIRDKFHGPAMGRVMSLIMMVFIVVPAVAPGLGQLIIYIGNWQSIFLVFIILAICGILLLRYTQDETLALDKRIPFSFSSIGNGIKETVSNGTSRGYTICAGLIFGAFVGYLSSAQQILQLQFNLGDSFSLYFGALALSIGVSSFINSKLIARFGMRNLSIISIASLNLLSIFYLVYIFSISTPVTLLSFVIYLGLSFLFIGILFGNLNTLAIAPLGHIAGVANSVISSFQTFISVSVGGVVGQLYNGTVIPLVGAFFLLSLISFIIIKFLTPSD